MALTGQILHHIFQNMALPYAPNTDPSSTTPRYVSGSNVLITTKGTVHRRFGFTTHTADDYSSDKIRRFFTWQKWGADFYVMLCEVEGSASKVYKQKVGTDAAFVLIHTDSSSTEPFDFVVSNDTVFYGNGTDMRKYDGTNEQKWGIAAPATAMTAANGGAGNVPAAIGHKWVFAYGNSTTGHISDISPIQSIDNSNANRQWDLEGARSADAQVDKIHIYRTEDGGSVFFELNGSPIANPGAGNWTHTDNEADATLSSTQAPINTINSVPTASKGMEFYNGRIWTFKNDIVYFSGLEEVNNGIFEESFPTDNEFRFGREVTGLKAVNGVLLVFTVYEVFRITGDSLSTFRRDTLVNRAGLRNRAAMAGAGNIVAWLDVSNTIRVSNGFEHSEISFPIRSEINSITHADAQMAFYDDGLYHWLMLMDGGADKIYVYDFDLDQWMPPWDITNMESIHSGETAAGTVKVFLGRGGKPLAMNTNNWNDDGVTFTANLVTGPMNVTDPSNPAQTGHIEWVGISRGSIALASLLRLFDEDPTTGVFTDLFSNEATPAYRSGSPTAVVDKWYPDRGATGVRASIKFTWAAANTKFEMFGFNVAYMIDR